MLRILTDAECRPENMSVEMMKLDRSNAVQTRSGALDEEDRVHRVKHMDKGKDWLLVRDRGERVTPFRRSHRAGVDGNCDQLGDPLSDIMAEYSPQIRLLRDRVDLTQVLEDRLQLHAACRHLLDWLTDKKETLFTGLYNALTSSGDAGQAELMVYCQELKRPDDLHRALRDVTYPRVREFQQLCVQRLQAEATYETMDQDLLQAKRMATDTRLQRVQAVCRQHMQELGHFDGFLGASPVTSNIQIRAKHQKDHHKLKKAQSAVDVFKHKLGALPVNKYTDQLKKLCQLRRSFWVFEITPVAQRLANRIAALKGVIDTLAKLVAARDDAVRDAGRTGLDGGLDRHALHSNDPSVVLRAEQRLMPCPAKNLLAISHSLLEDTHSSQQLHTIVTRARYLLILHARRLKVYDRIRSIIEPAGMMLPEPKGFVLEDSIKKEIDQLAQKQAEGKHARSVFGGHADHKLKTGLLSKADTSKQNEVLILEVLELLGSSSQDQVKQLEDECAALRLRITNFAKIPKRNMKQTTNLTSAIQQEVQNLEVASPSGLSSPHSSHCDGSSKWSEGSEILDIQRVDSFHQLAAPGATDIPVPIVQVDSPASPGESPSASALIRLPIQPAQDLRLSPSDLAATLGKTDSGSMQQSDQASARPSQADSFRSVGRNSFMRSRNHSTLSTASRHSRSSVSSGHRSSRGPQNRFSSALRGDTNIGASARDRSLSFKKDSSTHVPAAPAQTGRCKTAVTQKTPLSPKCLASMQAGSESPIESGSSVENGPGLPPTTEDLVAHTKAKYAYMDFYGVYRKLKKQLRDMPYRGSGTTTRPLLSSPNSSSSILRRRGSIPDGTPPSPQSFAKVSPLSRTSKRRRHHRLTCASHPFYRARNADKFPSAHISASATRLKYVQSGHQHTLLGDFQGSQDLKPLFPRLSVGVAHLIRSISDQMVDQSDAEGQSPVSTKGFHDERRKSSSCVSLDSETWAALLGEGMDRLQEGHTDHDSLNKAPGESPSNTYQQLSQTQVAGMSINAFDTDSEDLQLEAQCACSDRSTDDESGGISSLYDINMRTVAWQQGFRAAKTVHRESLDKLLSERLRNRSEVYDRQDLLLMVHNRALTHAATASHLPRSVQRKAAKSPVHLLPSHELNSKARPPPNMWGAVHKNLSEEHKIVDESCDLWRLILSYTLRQLDYPQNAFQEQFLDSIRLGLMNSVQHHNPDPSKVLYSVLVEHGPASVQGKTQCRLVDFCREHSKISISDFQSFIASNKWNASDLQCQTRAPHVTRLSKKLLKKLDTIAGSDAPPMAVCADSLSVLQLPAILSATHQ
eukprot:gene5237-938_t